MSGHSCFKIPRVEMRIEVWRKAVKDRAGGRCELRLAECDGAANQAHHIHRKGQGGLNDLDNGLALCSPCHDHVHAFTDEAAVNGWLRRQFPRPGDAHFVDEDPAAGALGYLKTKEPQQ